MRYVPDLLDKVQIIINKLCYCEHEHEQEFLRSNEIINNDLLPAINKAGEITDADLASPYTDSEDLDAFKGNINDDDLKFNSRQILCPSNSNYLICINTEDPHRFHTLKKRV
ncbi:unnamed protein product [Rotaria sp. Silwood1]|nr:unnamed protein product [Rotaria sp. Silwood1]